jgi:hypothetical protein
MTGNVVGRSMTVDKFGDGDGKEWEVEETCVLLP